MVGGSAAKAWMERFLNQSMRHSKVQSVTSIHSALAFITILWHLAITTLILGGQSKITQTRSHIRLMACILPITLRRKWWLNFGATTWLRTAT